MATLGARATDRCFSIPELTRRIINVGNDFTPRDLYSVALTCRVFLEPALDSMWATMANLGPILGLFPDAVIGWSREGWTVSCLYLSLSLI
jgi:hypothetical protein